MPRKTRTLKVFCEGNEQRELVKNHETIERYDSFLLIRASVAETDALTRTYPVEDITHLYRIHVGRWKIDTSKPRIDSGGKRRTHPAYKGVGRLSRGKHHYMVQFVGPIKRGWLSRLKRLGAEPRVPFADFTYIVRCTEATLKKVAAEPKVRWVGHLSHEHRIHFSQKSPLPRTRMIRRAFTIEFFDRADLKRGLGRMRRLGIEVLSTDEQACLVTVRLEHSSAEVQKLVTELSKVHGVRSIRKRALKRASNDVAAGIMKGGPALSAPLGLSGRGEVIAICDTGLDTGDAQHVHPDFRGRVLAIRSYPISPYFSPWIFNPGGNDGAADVASGHGTHVAGSALGNGKASESLSGQAAPIRGLAYRAKLVFQAVEQEMRWKNPRDYYQLGRYALAGIPDDLTSLFSYAYNKGARVHSNSWGGGEPGEYDSQCRQLDAFVWRRKDFCVLVAAGNDGTDADGDGVINDMSVTSPATAKNCITVGASESYRRQFDGETYGGWWGNDYPVPPYEGAPMANGPSQVAAFSSRGPTDDGRVKPDIVAPGTFILSTRSRMLDASNTAWAPLNQHYFYMGGTSMATPLVAGAVAVVREFLRRWVGFSNPSAALVKASLILGARKLSGYSPAGQIHDNDQGYGRVDLEAIVSPPRPVRVYFLDDSVGLHTGQSDTFHIVVRSSNTPLRIALAYSDFPGETLVNNLNLIVTDPHGRHYVGNGEAGGGLIPDTTNNTEVIQINRPRVGTWKLRVVASNVPEGPQDYAFVLSGDVQA